MAVALAAVLPLLLLASAPAASASEATGSISGAITVNKGPFKEPFSVIVFREEAGGVLVALPEQPAVEEAEGAYKIPKLADGTYGLKFVPANPALAYRYYGEAVTLATAGKAVVAGGGPTSSISVELQLAASIKGVVTDAATNAPLSGVTVEAIVEGAGGEVAGNATTAANGGYEITGLPAAAYRVRFAAGEHITQEVAGVNPPAGGPVQAENAALTPDAPHGSSSPQVSGAPVVGQTLNCSTGVWTGLAPIAYSFRWLRDGEAIGGATGSGYTAAAADQGHGLACEVTAGNSAGHAAARSTSLNVPPGSAPVTTPAAAATPSAPTASVAVSTTRLLFVRRTATALLACAVAPCSGTLVLTEPVMVTRLRGRKVVSRRRLTLTLATASFSLAAGRRAKVALHLTKVGRSWLKTTGSQRLQGILVISLRGAAPIRQNVVFRARAPGKHR